jgi:hypothetical protein
MQHGAANCLHAGLWKSARMLSHKNSIHHILGPHLVSSLKESLVNLKAANSPETSV